MLKKIFLVTVLSLIFFACNKNEKAPEVQKTNKGEFVWSDKLTVKDIPDFEIKGMLGGKEVKFEYVNFEKWGGSNDNVLNFSLTKPEQQCGFIESFRGFEILNKGNAIPTGETTKQTFSDDQKTFSVVFKNVQSDGSPVKSNSKWAMALVIESRNDKNVTGKIALCFNDEQKSWVAGKFTAVICNN